MSPSRSAKSLVVKFKVGQYTYHHLAPFHRAVQTGKIDREAIDQEIEVAVGVKGIRVW